MRNPFGPRTGLPRLRESTLAGTMKETRLIERLVAIGWRGSRSVLVGPGDDGAVLRGGLVLSTDLAVEGVHFRFDWTRPEEAGFRAAAAALSDLAAMGAAPEALLASLAAPGDAALCEALQRGIRDAGDRVGAPVAGGDLSRSPGPVVIDVAVVGRTRRPLLRGGAGEGDGVWVSGELGGAGGAVAAWSAGEEPSVRARSRFVRPPDRTGLGVALSREGLATAAIDISDGLTRDAAHLARRSGVALVIDAARLPLDPGAGGDLSLALAGGEDYELLFTAPEAAAGRIAALGRELAVPLTPIGMAERGEDVILLDLNGCRTPAPPDGYDHFAAPGDRS